MSTVVVACCQVAPVIGERAVNLEIIASAVQGAAALGSNVVVLPELVTSGYLFADRDEARANAEPADGPALTLWRQLAADHQLIIVGGFCELDADGDLRNSAAIVDKSGLRAVYRKAHLWDAERLIFKAGDAPPPVVETEFGRVSTMICYDLEFPEWVRLPALSGAQLLCAPVNWPASPRPDGERPAEVIRVQADAAVNRMFIAACDRVGSERGVEWVGGSVVVDADGWPLAGAQASTEAMTISALCRLEDASDKAIGGLSDTHADRRPELYGPVAERLLETPPVSRSRV